VAINGGVPVGYLEHRHRRGRRAGDLLISAGCSARAGLLVILLALGGGALLRSKAGPRR
jgi:hypothetical protein